VHRCRKRWEAQEDLADLETIEWRFFRETSKLFNLRKQLPALSDGGMEVIETSNPRLFAYLRAHAEQRLLIVTNFSEAAERLDPRFLTPWISGAEALDHLTGTRLSVADGLVLEHHRAVWLEV
jgi:amylosucrase